MTSRYDPATIEPKWQQAWEKNNAFATPIDVADLPKAPKMYILDMFPYPSGAGLHVGHPEGYTATDVLARLMRMRGYNVLHPMGWDAFGLPAERAAVREGEHPASITQRNIDNFRRQIKRLGFSYDWAREVSTADPSYYRWSQWIFLRLYEKGLAYLADVPVNWCPALGTVLANEEVKDGAYVETGDPVERRHMRQWMLKITDYAERLLKDLEDVDWPESVKEMQRHWIGKSHGASITFSLAHTDAHFEVFTTRPDTLFGCTYCVLAPEHPLVPAVTHANHQAEVQRYVRQAANKSDLLRTDLAREKTGVFSGCYAVHPLTGADVPIWIADYVLMGYGTGAIMAVPAHDERDHAFAQKFSLPIVEVIRGGGEPVTQSAHLGGGTLVNSGPLDGLPQPEAGAKAIALLEEKGLGTSQVQYRLRDWLFSRQRYWGEPFPLVHLDDGTVVPLPDDQLPVELPPVDTYKPTADGAPPLGRADAGWQRVTLPDGRVGRRELNTMPQWAGSCWYYLRYLDPHNDQAICSREAEQYWMPVDLYVGGVEHAVLHLLYARFWHKVLYDCGLVSTKEPFRKLFNQGMILAHSYRDAQGRYHSPEDVDQRDGVACVKATGAVLSVQVEKMSKSKLNVVNPDDVIATHGADAVRLYELFMGPLEATKPWQTSGVEGISRFLQRVWRLVVDEQDGNDSAKLTTEPAASEESLNKSLHRTIKKVLEDTEALRFNTAVAQMMIFVNDATGAKTLPRAIIKPFVCLLAPYAPHIAEELWQRLGETTLVSLAPAPAWDPTLVASDTITVVVQVNGKRRDNLSVAADATAKDLEELALQAPNTRRLIAGKTPRKIVVVPGRLVNIVV